MEGAMLDRIIENKKNQVRTPNFKVGGTVVPPAPSLEKKTKRRLIMLNDDEDGPDSLLENPTIPDASGRDEDPVASEGDEDLDEGDDGSCDEDVPIKPAIRRTKRKRVVIEDEEDECEEEEEEDVLPIKSSRRAKRRHIIIDEEDDEDEEEEEDIPINPVATQTQSDTDDEIPNFTFRGTH